MLDIKEVKDMSSKQRNQNAPSTARKQMDDKAKPGKSSQDMKRSRARRMNNRVTREQPRKDSSSKRVNYDNAREDKVAKQIREDANKRGNNDISLWNKSPELLKSAGSLPFASILGEKLFNAVSVPGVLSLTYVPGFGPGTDLKAINQASDQNYSYVVHANSRNYNYTAPDSTILSMGGMEFFAIMASIIRAYGTVKTYAEPNYYYPDALLEAQGFIPQDLRTNLSNMWFDINNLIDRSRQIWIPNVYPIMKRKFDLNSNIWMDAQGPRAQSYVFTQSKYFMYSDTAFTTGSALIPVVGNYRNGNGSSGAATTSLFQPGVYQYYWVEWYNTANEMLNRLINSEDRGIIYGDLLNAYGADKLYTLAPIPADYRISPVYNMEMMMEIENAVVMHSKYTPTCIYQSEEDIYAGYQPYTSLVPSALNNSGAPSSTVLNMHVAGQPTPEDVMIATRLQASSTTLLGSVFTHDDVSYEGENGITPTQNDYTMIIDNVGTEYITNMYVWYYGGNAADPYGAGPFLISNIYGTSGPTALAMGHLMAFDWHPFVYRMSFIPPSTKPANTQIGTTYWTADDAYGDFDNYITLSAPELRKLHNTALYSAWGVPLI